MESDGKQTKATMPLRFPNAALIPSVFYYLYRDATV
jgi:hypothetical protein